MLQEKSKNRAEANAPFEQQDRDEVRSERPRPRAGRPLLRTDCIEIQWFVSSPRYNDGRLRSSSGTHIIESERLAAV